MNAATVILLIVAAYSLSRPGAPVRSGIEEWWKQANEPTRIARVWARLTEAGGRLDSGTASVGLVEFSDFECPYCKQNHGELVAFLERHPEVGVVYRHLPLAVHAAAEGAARAAICAESQGAFRRLHDYFFETTQWPTDTNWVVAARAAKVPDLGAFEECRPSTATTDRLKADRALAQALGITGTPTFVTERHMATGLQSDSALKRLLGIER